jgi:serine/threonine protein kinase
MPSTGQTVLHYELGDKLGAGGMGEVFRARDTRLGQEVTLKFIAPEYREDTDRRARLLKEAQAASALRSHAIATTYDIGESGRDLFIVMELVEGEPLSERLRRGPLPVPRALRMAGQVADHSTRRTAPRHHPS